MKKYLYGMIVVLALNLSLTKVQAQEASTPDVEEIVKKANLVAYYQADDGKAKVTMTITPKQGPKRKREFNILRKDVADGGDQNYYVYFLNPPDVRKMVYMVHKHVDKDDDRWLYLSAIDRVNRVAAGDKRTSFVGSDFLYEDVSGRGLDQDVHELTATTETQYVVKNTPKRPDSVGFSYYTVAIDRANYVPMKMAFFDKSGKLYRSIESTEVEEVDGFVTVLKSVVKDLRTGSQTEMAFSKVKFNVGLKDIFQERYLKRAPSEARR
ncbi:MAG: outer membrane lipoprotein-sorting protein [Phycisphaeraceae bacterium]|nr:outer membrane lipoprotein-sorting protein [Phycisphaeraceae bacterium]